MRRSRPSLSLILALLLAVCLCLVLVAAPASATLSYPSPQIVSAAGANASNPQVAIDGSGRATIVWQGFEYDEYGFAQYGPIQSVRIDADGSPGPVQTLSEAGLEASDPQVAIDGADRATVVWSGSDGSDRRIHSVRLAANGIPGPVQTLSGAGRNAYEPQIAIDGADRAVIIWQKSEVETSRRIQTVRLDADGTPGPIQSLSPPGEGAFEHQVAIDGSDRATVVWRRHDDRGDGGIRYARIQSIRLDADGTPGPVQTLSEAGRSAHSPQIAIDGLDRATIVWQGFDGSTLRIQSIRLDADGTPGPIQTHSEAGREAILPQVAIDGSDRATIAWQRQDLFTNRRIQSVRLDADGTPGPVRTLSEAGENAGIAQVAIDSSDRATITWFRHDGSDFRVQSVRLAADGAPGPVQTVSPAGQSASAPQLGLDGSDRATIVWDGWDGAHERIFSVRADISYPKTTITSGPEGITENVSPSFTFTADEPGSTFQCSLDSEPFDTCASPESYLDLADGPHSFAVRAVDAEGDADPTPAERSFTVATADGSATAEETQAQKGKRIVVEVRIEAGENLTATARGRVRVDGDAYTLKPKAKHIPTGKSKILKLKPRRSEDAKAIASALKGGTEVTAKLRVKLTNRLGLVRTEKLSIKLKP